MRILFYSQSSTVYGSPASLVNIISGLQEIDSSLEIMVVIPSKGELEDKLTQENIKYRIIPHFKWVYNYKLFQRKLKQNKALAYLWLYKNVVQRHLQNMQHESKHHELIEEFKPDLIYVNSSISPMGCRVAVKNEVPYIWHHRETVNDPITGFYLDNKRSFRNYFRKTDLHLYPSQFLERSYSQFDGQYHKVIYNGVPDAATTVRKKKKESPVKFGVAGRINEQKGQREVLEVLKHLPSNSNRYELHIFGDGPTNFVDNLRENYSDTKIVFRGFQDVSVVYENLDYLIVSGKNESFGRTVAEANARGIPVIALRSGALQEIVREEVNGLLYETPEELSLVLQKILKNDFAPGFYEQLAENSRRLYVENFSVRICSERIYAEISKFERDAK